MSFDIKQILGIAGDVALSFVPGASPVLKGLAGVAKMIGGETGQKIEGGIAMLSEGLSAVGKQPLSPEQQVEQEKIRSAAEIELAEIAYRNKKLGYDDQAGGRDIVKTALTSDDPLVRQARPKVMILLGKVAMLYTILTPILILDMGYLGINKDLISMTVNLILWQGGMLWSAFTASFTGYTVARSADKKIAGMVGLGMEPSKLLESLSKIGNKIS